MNKVFATSLVLTLVAMGCGRSPSTGPESGEQAQSGRSTVYAVNYPLAVFAERIGGENVQVVFPAPADVDPAFWKPDADTVVAFQQADLILLNGAGYAKWVDRVSLPLSRMVHTGAALEDQRIQLEDQVTHSHGPGGAHEHGAYAFTTWLDPDLAAAQARIILEALSNRHPDQAAGFQQRFEDLSRDLEQLDLAVQSAADALGDAPVVFSHPVYQYLQRRYALTGKSLHWEPDQAPDDSMWDDLQTLLADFPARLMIWEDTPLPETRQRLESLGLRCVVFNPCGNTPEEGDYLTVMRQNAERLAAAADQVSSASDAGPSNP